MLSEQTIAEILLANPRLRDAGEALIAAANDAGGRDNITVLLLRLEEVLPGQPAASEHDTIVGAPAVEVPPAVEAPASRTRAPLTPRPRAAAPQGAQAHPRRLRRAGALIAVLAVVGVLGAAAYLALQSVYFVSTNDRGLVTMYRGLPFRLPGNLALYSSSYVSGVSASSLSAARRRTLLDHSLRSEGDAASLIRSLELNQLE
jgi:protein phosphatase